MKSYLKIIMKTQYTMLTAVCQTKLSIFKTKRNNLESLLLLETYNVLRICVIFG